MPLLVRAGLPTAGFRIPSLEVTRSLIRTTGPLVMPSANLSGCPSATSPDHVETDFGQNFPVLDGEIRLKGVESTIILYQEPEWVIVRLGAIAPELFEPILGYQPRYIQREEDAQPLSPGQMYRHYAPKAHLFLGDSSALEISMFVLGFKERKYPSGKQVIFLGSLSNPEEVAENLYLSLRELDQKGAESAWVDMDFPRHGLWQTIAERLNRAGDVNVF